MKIEFAEISVLVAVVVGVSCAIFSNKNDRMFYVMFLMSTFYYCCGALLYWRDYKGGYFINVYWGDDISRAVEILSMTSTFVMVVVWFLIGSFRRNVGVVYNTFHISGVEVTARYDLFLKMGITGAGYVIFSSVIHGGLDKTDSFVLIAYQFSDILIPVIIFNIAVVGLNIKNVSLMLFFVFYAMMAGLRYKLFLLMTPLLIGYLFSYDPNKGVHAIFKRFSIAAVGGVLLLLLFSFMTTSRNKFEGVDFNSGAFSSLEDQLYGLFAESNIIFGLVAAMHEFLDVNDPPYAYFSPVIDSVLELLPRFLFPWRVTGLYYQNVAAGLLTEEAYNSATTYPFVGEYIVMYGYVGLIFGCICFALIYFMCSNSLMNDKNGTDLAGFYGYGLLAAFFGYYAYSRGYIPQVFKGFLFVVLPYLSLVRQGRLAFYRRFAVD